MTLIEQMLTPFEIWAVARALVIRGKRGPYVLRFSPLSIEDWTPSAYTYPQIPRFQWKARPLKRRDLERALRLRQ